MLLHVLGSFKVCSKRRSNLLRCRKRDQLGEEQPEQTHTPWTRDQGQGTNGCMSRMGMHR
jgi:hypothetical protein